jgi:hypothetical protein
MMVIVAVMVMVMLMMIVMVMVMVIKVMAVVVHSHARTVVWLDEPIAFNRINKLHFAGEEVTGGDR